MFRIAVGLITGLLPVLAWAAQIEGVRMWRAPDNTRFVFDLTGPVEHKLFTLEGPDRIVIDIENASLGGSLAELSLGGTPVKGIRYGVRDNSGLRVVLDLNEQLQPRSFVLPQHADKPDRLVLDLYDQTYEPVRPEPVQRERASSGRRDVIIAVDAGHGGEDPGALGPQNIREKDVVMAISKKLVEMINSEPGYKAYLVRTGDYYVPLRTRRDRARELRADLFISVHADAFKNPRASGASVFALSRSGATSESARFLAASENEADLIGGVGGVSLNNVDNVLAGVLVDLSMTATLSSSLDVGARVLQEMGKLTRLHKPQVEQAGFAVLKSPDVPSILVETGFISNPGEAKKLATASYRRQLANAIFQGVQTYFSDRPPPDSFIAWRANNEGQIFRHTIASGDTLSEIAQRYNITLRTLLEHNGLSSSTVIRVGQRLSIPAG